MTVSIQKKICMLGDFSIGKTSLVRRFSYDDFDGLYLTTVGVNMTRVDARVEETVVRLVIWDMAGSEMQSRIKASYLQGASGALLVCDLTRPETLANLNRYYMRLRDISPKATVMWVGNKKDLHPTENDTVERLRTAAATFHEPVCFTSALSGAGVSQAFTQLAAALLANAAG